MQHYIHYTFIWLWLLAVAMAVAGAINYITHYSYMVTCLYSYKAMCRLYNYGLRVYIQKAVWLQGYNAKGEEAMRPQSNIAIWQIYMAT